MTLSTLKSGPISDFFQDSECSNQPQDRQAHFSTSFEEFGGSVVSVSIFEIGGKYFSISCFIIVYFFRPVRGCVITQTRVSPWHCMPKRGPISQKFLCKSALAQAAGAETANVPPPRTARPASAVSLDDTQNN